MGSAGVTAGCGHELPAKKQQCEDHKLCFPTNGDVDQLEHCANLQIDTFLIISQELILASMGNDALG